MATARGSASSDFEREALRDGAITREEYERGYALFAQCMAARGADTEVFEDYGGFLTYSVKGDDVDMVDRQVDECSEGTTSLVGPLFVEISRNPNQEDYLEMVVQCLVKVGIAPHDYDRSRLEADLESGDIALVGDGQTEPLLRCLQNASLVLDAAVATGPAD